MYIYNIYIYIHIYIYIYVYIYIFSRLVSAATVFKWNFKINNFLQNEIISNGFWKNMTKFSFMCDMAAMKLVKMDIKNQCYSRFIKYEAYDLILLGVTFQAF